MSRTDEILKAAKMPPEAVKMSRYIDAVYFPILCILLVGTYHMHFMLLAGGLGLLAGLEGPSMVAGGNAHRRHHLLCCHHVLPVGQL